MARPRAVALRAGQPETPGDAVLKATCSKRGQPVIPAHSLRMTTEQPAQELAEIYRDDILEALGVLAGAPEREIELGQIGFERTGNRMFVILSAEAVACGVGPELWERYGLDHPVYLIVEDARPITAAELGLAVLGRVAPDMDADIELDASQRRRRIVQQASA
jgi:hypothetical protein